MSGVSAAKTLTDGGITDFLMFEGNGEIGGRVRSQVLKSSGARIELGANWIEEIDPKHPDRQPLWHLAQQCGGLDGIFMNSTIYDRYARIYDHDGMNISGDINVQKRLKQLRKITEHLNEYANYRTRHQLPDITIRKAFTDLGWIPKTLLDNALEWTIVDYWLGCPPQKASFLFNYPSDNHETYLVTDQKTGYVKIIDCLAKSFLKTNDTRLHLNSLVKEINWSHNCVCVTAVERGLDQTYCAPFAIISFGIGVLKSNFVTFKPPLPSFKAYSINKLGDGFYLKLYLEFSETFWKEDQVNNIIHADLVRGNYIHFQSFSQVLPGNPSILLATVTGEKAKSIYNLTKMEIEEHIMTILRTIYGKAIPNPVALTIPDWGINPLYNEMYSFRAYGFTSKNLKSIRAPMGSVYFTGAALSDDDEFLHGAYLSGITTANEILEVISAL